MDWKQKLKALQAINRRQIQFGFRGNETWYLVNLDFEIGGDGFLRGGLQSGSTPWEAVDQAWNEYAANLGEGLYLVLPGQAASPRQHFRWNGFMWAEIPL